MTKRIKPLTEVLDGIDTGTELNLEGTVKHKKKRIDAGHYEYRGYTIQDFYMPGTSHYITAHSLDRWQARKEDYLDLNYTLSDAIRRIDEHEDNQHGTT